MWNAAFTPQAQDSIQKLDKTIRHRIIKKIEWLTDNAEAVKHRRLSGQLSDFYKLRVGDYRVLYRLRTKKRLIRIEQVGHRSEIYGN